MAPPMQNQSYLLKALLVFYCIVPAFLFAQKIKSNSWAETKTSGSGVLTFYWFESRPFIYKNEVGQLMGIEHDVMLGFTQYLKAKHGISLQVQWIEAAGFQNVIDRVGQSTEPCFGASAFSITDERKKDPNYPYITKGDLNGDNKTDYAVLITDDKDSFDELNVRLAIIPAGGPITLSERLYTNTHTALVPLPPNSTITDSGEKIVAKSGAIHVKSLNTIVESVRTPSYIYWDGARFKDAFTSMIK